MTFYPVKRTEAYPKELEIVKTGLTFTRTSLADITGFSVSPTNKFCAGPALSLMRTAFMVALL